jgi:hypothetical protein
MNYSARVVLTLCAFVMMTTFQPAFARDDPYGCRARVRGELGAAPGMGPNYPGFWGRVRNCVRAAGGGGAAPATRTASRDAPERASEKNRNEQRKLQQKERQAAARTRARSDEREKQNSEPRKTTSIKPSAPVQLSVLPTPANISEPGRRVALVIGNGQYKHVPTLPNANHDAEALARTLEASGFESVTLRSNLRREEIVSALAAFARIADTADWAVVYYSGHGIESRGVNYMIPVDAELKVDRDIDLEAVDASKVLAALEGTKKLKLVILDACRDNPFFNQMKRTVATRSISRGLARIEPDAGVLIVYSAKHGETALDGEGQNSPFATALMNRIQTPNLEIRRLFDLVRDDVLATTNHRQQPFSYGSLSGSEDFYFKTK